MSKKMVSVVVMRKLLFVTGTRADFGKLEPLALLARDQGVLASQNSPTKMELRPKT